MNRKHGTNQKSIKEGPSVIMGPPPECEPSLDPVLLEGARSKALNTERKESAMDALSYSPPFCDLRTGLPFMRDLGLGEGVLDILDQALAQLSELRSLWASAHQDCEDAQWAYILVHHGIMKGDVLSGEGYGQVHMNRVEHIHLQLKEGGDESVTLYGTRVRADGSLGKAHGLTRLEMTWKRVGHIPSEVLSDGNRESLASLESIYRFDRFEGYELPIGTGHKDPQSVAELRARATEEALRFYREVQETVEMAVEALGSEEARELIRLVPDLTGIASRLEHLLEALRRIEADVEEPLASVAFDWIALRYGISVGDKLRSTTPRETNQGRKGALVSVDCLDHFCGDEKAPVLSGTRLRKDGSIGKKREWVYLIPGWWERA